MGELARRFSFELVACPPSTSGTLEASPTRSKLVRVRELDGREAGSVEVLRDALAPTGTLAIPAAGAPAAALSALGAHERLEPRTG